MNIIDLVSTKGQAHTSETQSNSGHLICSGSIVASTLSSKFKSVPSRFYPKGFLLGLEEFSGIGVWNKNIHIWWIQPE